VRRASRCASHVPFVELSIQIKRSRACLFGCPSNPAPVARLVRNSQLFPQTPWPDSGTLSVRLVGIRTHSHAAGPFPRAVLAGG
jgi:hypothetical protein